MQGLHHRVKDRQHRTGRDRIEQITDLIVARDPGDPKQAQGVIAPLGGLQRALEIQERGALREEHRERTQGGIGHRIGRRARALIREALDHRAQVLNQALEGLWAGVESKRKAHRCRECACSFPTSFTASVRKCPAHKHDQLSFVFRAAGRSRTPLPTRGILGTVPNRTPSQTTPRPRLNAVLRAYAMRRQCTPSSL